MMNKNQARLSGVHYAKSNEFKQIINIPMHIHIITPALASSLSGNRATAGRWQDFLEQSGHQVTVSVNFIHDPAKPPVDMMIALHAWRSAEAINNFRAAYPEKPLILALTGTDIYKFQISHPNVVYHSMEVADALIGLHKHVDKGIPERFHAKLFTVLQSATLTNQIHRESPSEKQDFIVSVIGHLREEKDSLRAATAVRELPAFSQIKIIQAGKAHNETWQSMAESECQKNTRYQWLGEISHQEIEALMAKSKVMVISSMMEGGANVVSEACVSGLAIIASDISGNRGLLGDDYPAYFKAGDAQALRKLLLKAEAEPQWLALLQSRCSVLAENFHPACEKMQLDAVVNALLAKF